ncbi:AAA family ATPase [Niabella pedocola]|uniref:AAA family ATPase n=1 Tax=Niabella pedocola TaxID=1752077 RepID=A0ABS8PKT6_9BACT|nr:AAA family ATPase [Niabella pedocola]MCD2421722.1 AAA family ATPase [Niabella pedocola]
MKNKNPQLLILIGAPGSGKTTFAKYHVRTHINWVRVCRDDFRTMQFSQTFLSDEMEAAVTEMIFATIEKTLTRKMNVLVDATHTKAEYLEQYTAAFAHLADIAFKVFDIPQAELLLRCKKREAATGKWIPPKAISRHSDALEKLKANFDLSVRHRQRMCNTVKRQDINLPRAVICDLDGTLALMDHRDPFDASDCENDRLNKAVADTLIFYQQNGHHILLVSGREDKYQQQTLRFLKKHAIHFDALWMRPSGNYIKDSVLKKELFKQQIEGRYHVSLVLDDRDQVVDMWRKELQLPCFQVFYGPF